MNDAPVDGGDQISPALPGAGVGRSQIELRYRGFHSVLPAAVDRIKERYGAGRDRRLLGFNGDSRQANEGGDGGTHKVEL